jgi:hypothetical protein
MMMLMILLITVDLMCPFKGRTLPAGRVSFATLIFVAHYWQSRMNSHKAKL